MEPRRRRTRTWRPQAATFDPGALRAGRHPPRDRAGARPLITPAARYCAPDGIGARREFRVPRVAAVSNSYGRMRIIVFPLRRSVGLRAATASSRVATVPML